jgi:membrane protein DedA with SNARE-associated domain
MDSLVDFLLNFYGPTPYLVIFGILLLCGMGLPIPEDVTLFAAGLMAYYGVSDLGVMIAVSLLGVLIGDAIVFFLGHKYGRKLTKKWFFHKLLPDDRLNAVSLKFKARGDKLLFVARFMPGFRAPIFFSAGTLHVPFGRFILFDGCAALISVPLIIGAVYHFGDSLDEVVRWVKRVEGGILFVIVGVIAAFAAKWYITHRRLAGRVAARRGASSGA